jgi:prolyl oligopeptidase
MRLALTAAAAAVLLAATASVAQPVTTPGATVQTISPADVAVGDDPYVWLEEMEGARALDWARAENARSQGVLESDPRYKGLYDDALKIVTARDRIASPSFRGRQIDNFWQDRDHVRGLWRRTTLESYRTETPEWRTVLDVDALAKAENANWVYKGADCLSPDERLCLVDLSNGGKDAVEVREFDSETGRFVDGGFRLPEGKQNTSWLDKDTLLVAREWGPDTLTESGYPFVLKVLKRGQPLDQAVELLRGAKTDVSVSPYVLRDRDGRIEAVMASRAVSFFESEQYLLGDAKGLGKAVKLPFPLKASIQGTHKGQLVFSIEQDWPEKGFKEGDLLAYDLAALKRDPASARPVLILRPGPREAIEGITFTRTKMVMALYENVKGAAYVWDVGPKGWTRTRLDLPGNASVNLGSASEHDDRVFVSVASYLEPTTLWLADTATLKTERVKSSPARFDATDLVTEQFEAVSTDGTRVPYFVVHHKNIKLDGSNPTLLYAYGGFQSSQKPNYSGTVGKLWLERGGVYAVANIRGGGEFGPTWWSAGLKQNRQKVFDDFAAVAKDMIARKITSPRRLGIQGGSNGGLLMGVQMTQHPELYRAVVIQVPLLDMIRYTQIGAGASWVGEYGDPAIPAERDYILKYSPYQAIKAGQPYPEPLFVTSTKDDRVSPAHARKAAAKLKALGYPYYYYENVDGGHAAAANLEETAHRVALEYSYLFKKLVD